MSDPSTPSTITTPDPPSDRTVAVIVGDLDGWTIDATIGAVIHRTPAPISATAVGEYLRLLLPELNADRVHARTVSLDPENMLECFALSDALYTATGIEHDGITIRAALRTLRSPR